MRTTFKFWLALLASCISGLGAAQAPVAMVLNVDGEVSIEVSGKTTKLEAFTRLLEGDRVKLGKIATSLSLVYPRNGRQETWTGHGIIVTGHAESTPVNGQLQVAIKHLPTKVTQMMAYTPTSDSTGKAGMVRLRNIQQADELAALEKTYQELKSSATPGDRSPEIYYLAGLFKLGGYDLLRNQLSGFEQQYPGDESIGSLGKLYSRAINALGQSPY